MKFFAFAAQILFLLALTPSFAKAANRPVNEADAVVVDPRAGTFDETSMAVIARCQCAPVATSKTYPDEIPGKPFPPSMRRRVRCDYLCRDRSGELVPITDSLLAADSGNDLSCRGTVYGARGVDVNNGSFLVGIRAFNARVWRTENYLPRIQKWAAANSCKGKWSDGMDWIWN